jgi:hypothetical protein
MLMHGLDKCDMRETRAIVTVSIARISSIDDEVQWQLQNRP